MFNFVTNKTKINKMALEITDSNFKEIVLETDKPVLVDFWATWCGPCRMVGPIVDERYQRPDGLDVCLCPMGLLDLLEISIHIFRGPARS